MCLSIGQLRTIKTHYLTNTSHLVASIKHIFDYNIQQVKVIRICEEGYHLFIILSPATMSQKKRAWFEKNKSMHNISIDLSEEDPNIGITDDHGRDIDEANEDCLEISVLDKGDNVAGGGNHPAVVRFPDPKHYLEVPLFQAIEFPGTLTSVEQNKIIIDICIACMEEKRDKFRRSEMKVMININAGNTEEEDVNLEDSLEKRTLDNIADAAGVELEQIVFFFDGDHPQIEAIMDFIIRNKLTKFDFIDFIKFPGGCSLSFQPNDLMRAFKLLKNYSDNLNSADSASKEVPKPRFFSKLIEFLRREGVKGKSLETYGVYFNHVLNMESRAFVMSVVQSGWRISGIYPHSIMNMLITNDKFNQLPDPDKDIVIAAIPLLRPYADIHGRVDEKHMMSLLGADLLNTKITDYDTKPMNQQRAMVLNTAGSIQFKQDLFNKKMEKEAEDAKKKQRAEEAKRLKAKALDELVTIKDLTGPPLTNKSCMSPICANNFDLSTPNHVNDVLWTGCPICKEYWACNKTICKNILLNHRKVCHLRKFP